MVPAESRHVRCSPVALLLTFALSVYHVLCLEGLDSLERQARLAVQHVPRKSTPASYEPRTPSLYTSL